MNEDARHRRAIPYTRESRGLGVIVGFDASDQGTRALHYAAVEAHRRSLPLTVISAFTVPRAVAGYVDSAAEITGDSLARRGAEDMLDEAREHLRNYPGTVAYRVEHGDAAGVMIARSENAAFAVVGGRGRGGFVGRLLGSVSSALPAHAHCPTTVVNRRYDPGMIGGATRFTPRPDDRPVIVGVDGSRHGRVAALHAAEAAMARGTNLEVLLALPPIDSSVLWYSSRSAKDAGITDKELQGLQERLDGEARWLGSHFPGLSIEGVLEEGSAAHVMASATARAQLTVMGTRGRGGITSALLGSVSRSVLIEARGPVQVVPLLADARLENHEEFSPVL
ncbi:universal stress protein [Nesterenkonia xinjiangensis]|uniref:Nucleotide-binding universal stress UspA family protein n=1 Tax=Nesterenkonia xinjiangensis TaxID=225327 RepID=A0A7Z0GJJ8_9MICC|nr:universal stress protein [Nesterenkonia xinjiangensis]NYJ77186.1 nucleotide-binding universal stress UspA family protein [Nesterenkonia xinjiangensis]